MNGSDAGIKDHLSSVDNLGMIRKMIMSMAMALLLSACSGNVFDLAVGDCFDDGDLAIGPEVQEVGDLPLVDCSEPHDNEVYEVAAVEDDAYPGDDAMAGRADGICHDAFEAFVGRDYQSSVLDFGWLAPTAESWDQGDRAVACFVYRVDLGKVTGTLAGSGI